MRPSCSPRSFLLVTFQEYSLVLSMTKSLGACWQSLPGERNINSRVFSTKLFTKSEASFLSCQCLFRGITLKISPSEDPSLLWSNCKQQSWAGLSPLLYVKISLWARATLPFLMCPIHPFPLFSQLLCYCCPLHTFSKDRIQSIALWLLDAAFGNMCSAYPREPYILGTILPSLGTKDKRTRFIPNPAVLLGAWLSPLLPSLLPCIQWPHFNCNCFCKDHPALIFCRILLDSLYMCSCWPLCLSKISLSLAFQTGHSSVLW